MIQLNLHQYTATLKSQGIATIDSLLQVSFEDLEEIGINKLGHQKKLTLAVERLKKLKTQSAVTSGGCNNSNAFHANNNNNCSPTMSFASPVANNLIATPPIYPRRQMVMTSGGDNLNNFDTTTHSAGSSSNLPPTTPRRITQQTANTNLNNNHIYASINRIQINQVSLYCIYT